MNEFRVIVTGSRELTRKQRLFVEKTLEDELYEVSPACADGDHAFHVVIVQGECPRGGVDEVAKNWAEQQGYEVESFPADWGAYGKGAGPRRNKQMVEAGAQLCLAFPNGGYNTSRGTWGCVFAASVAGIPVLVFGLPKDERKGK